MNPAGSGVVTMFDRRRCAQQFRDAVMYLGSSRASQDSTQKFAILFRIPTLAANRSTKEEKTSNHPEICPVENGIDWNGVLNSWLEVYEAAEKVCNASNAILHLISLIFCLLLIPRCRVKQRSVMKAKRCSMQLLISCMRLLWGIR